MRVTMPKWLDVTIHLFLLYILVAVGLTFGVWQFCHWQLTSVIESNSEFAQHLADYAQPGQTRRLVVNTLTVIEPLAITARQAKSVGVWDALSSLPGLPTALIDSLTQSLDKLLMSGEQLKIQLDSLAQLHNAAIAVEQYLASPTKETQIALYQSLIDHSENISLLLKNLNSTGELVGSTADSISVIANILEIEKVEGNFLTKPTSGFVYQAIAPLQQQTSDLHNALFFFSTTLKKDADSINRIINITERAMLIEQIVVPSFMRPFISVFLDHITISIGTMLLYILIRLRFTFPI